MLYNNNGNNCFRYKMDLVVPSVLSSAFRDTNVLIELLPEVLKTKEDQV